MKRQSERELTLVVPSPTMSTVSNSTTRTDRFNKFNSSSNYQPTHCIFDITQQYKTYFYFFLHFLGFWSGRGTLISSKTEKMGECHIIQFLADGTFHIRKCAIRNQLFLFLKLNDTLLNGTLFSPRMRNLLPLE